MLIDTVELRKAIEEMWQTSEDKLLKQLSIVDAVEALHESLVSKIEPGIKLPTFNCIALLDKYLQNQDAINLKPGVVGYWEGSHQPISIVGKKRCKSAYFGQHWAIRWESPHPSRLFQKGLARYMSGAWQNTDYPNLPEVK